MDNEWIDPRYAEVVAAWKRAQETKPGDEPAPRRMFLIPQD